ACTNRRSTRFTGVSEIRCIHQRDASFTDELRNLLHRDFRRFTNFLDRRTSVFSEEFDTSLVFPFDLLHATHTDVSDSSSKYPAAARAIGDVVVHERRPPQVN